VLIIGLSDCDGASGGAGCLVEVWAAVESRVEIDVRGGACSFHVRQAA
jgi:hypothetical protein